jgi:hypothetical protein
MDAFSFNIILKFFKFRGHTPPRLFVNSSPEKLVFPARLCEKNTTLSAAQGGDFFSTNRRPRPCRKDQLIQNFVFKKPMDKS